MKISILLMKLNRSMCLMSRFLQTWMTGPKVNLPIFAEIIKVGWHSLHNQIPLTTNSNDGLLSEVIFVCCMYVITSLITNLRGLCLAKL